MSIEMDNPQTVGEKVDAAANLVEQMNLARMVGDDAQFKKAHTRAGELLFQAMRQIEEEEDGGDPKEDVEGIKFTEGAEIAYQAYAASTGNKTHDGREMPAWADLGERVQTAWEASVRQTIYMVLGIESNPEDWTGWVRQQQ